MSAPLLDDHDYRTTKLAIAGRVKLQAQVDQWNDAYEIGDDVIVTKDLGEEVATKTRSRAKVLSGHTAVIWLEGITGCYLLDRVRPA